MKETVIMPCTHYSHCVANIQNTMIVGDGKDPEKPISSSPICAAQRDPGLPPRLELGTYFDPGIGEYINQDAIRTAVFAGRHEDHLQSDKEGKPCVYLTDFGFNLKTMGAHRGGVAVPLTHKNSTARNSPHLFGR
jgi:hypothetical protein